MSITVRTEIKTNEFKAYSKKASNTVNRALNRVLDDLVRTSSQSAPHDKGILEKSWSKEVKLEGLSPVGIVSYTVKKAGGAGKQNGNFNYALKMHETNYNLGEGSRAKPGGTGMSGKTYPVGKGFLAGVLNGEAETYQKHIDKAIKRIK